MTFSMTSRSLLLALGTAAAGLLAVALVAQYGFGLHPCELCMYQRYPYMAIIVLGAGGALLVKPPQRQWKFAFICGLLLLFDGGIAWYHAGVEWGIFPGPTACSAAASSGETLEDMRRAILNAPLVPCNQPMAHILGLSLAAWNGIAAALLAMATFSLLGKIHDR
ncbi:MAG: disulfide bond formation protein B [Pseudomonadota bacterium]|nr:disulfide bond formation protein B [Pseudomonadota bacterium]